MTDGATQATTMLGVAILLGAAGCVYEHSVGGDDTGEVEVEVEVDDAVVPPATRLCTANGTSTVTGRGPAGRLDGHHVFVNVRGGVCRATIELVLSPEPELTMPYHPGTVVIVAPTPSDLLDRSSDLTATLPATITDRTGQVAVEGWLEILEPTVVDSSVAPRLHATATFAAAGWQLSATVDATYCLVDECPAPIAAAAGGAPVPR